MPPKRQTQLTGPGGAHIRSRGVARDVYDALTSSENRSVVTSVAFFAAGVAFLHSSWAEILLPPI